MSYHFQPDLEMVANGQQTYYAPHSHQGLPTFPVDGSQGLPSQSFTPHDQLRMQPGPPYSHMFPQYANLPSHHQLYPQYYHHHDPFSHYPSSPTKHRQGNDRPHAVLPQPISQFKTQKTPNQMLGPPRKPRQTPYTLWVGNLPAHATITALKDHFSAGCTAGIESVFLISRTKCAFVNYKTQDAVNQALQRFQNSQFGGVTLVCRPRRSVNQGHSNVAQIGSVSTDKDDTSPCLGDCAQGEVETRSSSIDTGPLSTSSSLEQNGTSTGTTPSSRPLTLSASTSQSSSSPYKTPRFFIMKSLDIRDLEQAVRDSHWATQRHNAATLNEAFLGASAVYLIFSANRSGYYFGYARMLGTIKGNSNDEINDKDEKDDHDKDESNDKDTESDGEGVNKSPQLLSPSPPTVRVSLQAKVLRNERRHYALSPPQVEATLATKTAPSGLITTDSYRDTVFWEADGSDSKEGDEECSSSAEGDMPNINKLAVTDEREDNFERAFPIAWMSTRPLPFRFTRNMHNPWNRNLEIKVARDGTELEPSVGARLLECFH